MMDQIKELPTGKISAAIAVLVVSIAVMMLIFTWLQKADYQVLYSSLSDDDAGRIIQELKDKKIPYQLNSSGTVMVSADKVYDLRLQLASQGLPQGGGVGFEIFDNTSFTTSEFVQKLNYKRALEGELSRTIRSLSGVEQGRVHLVIPERTAFAFQQDKVKSSAAIFITLNKGRKLSSKEVEGIVHLVSSSVEDLSPGNITVVDNKGTLLTKPSDDGPMNISGSHMEYRQNYENNVNAKILEILEPVVGRGNVKAKVSALFNFTRSERTEEIYDPDGVVVRSEQKSTEKTTSGVAGGGIPGVASNLPGGAGARQSSQGLSQKSDEMINYETSKTIKRTIDSPVIMERMTVAILIDGILPSQKSSIENPDQYTMRTEEDLKYYEDIVKKTIGFTDDRGDEISVTVMPFMKIEVEEMPEAEKDYMPTVIMVLKYLVPAIIALLFFLIVARPLINSITRSMPQAPARPRASAAPGGGAETALEEPLQIKEIPMEKQVIDWAAGNPEQAAGLVKGWMEEK